MAFEVKRLYRPTNGQELKELLPARIAAAMMLDNTLNMARSFPLFKYKITIELVPYHPAGPDHVIADDAIVYEVDGETFVPYTEHAVQLVEESPIYGKEADPQDLRSASGMAVVDLGRDLLGGLTDVRVKQRPPEPAPPEPVKAILDVPAPDEPAEATYQVEEGRWARSHQDSAVEAAVKDMDPNKAPGRVSIVRSAAEGGGQERGRKR